MRVMVSYVSTAELAQLQGRYGTRVDLRISLPVAGSVPPGAPATSPGPSLLE